MKKLFLFYALILSALLAKQANAQSFSVPSPSASQMTRYGGSSINESSGRVTTSIPVYKYNAGNLSVPIGLNYVGNGVKIDQHSNWVGTNWLLNSGGVITRVVNHIADESAQNRLYFDNIDYLSDSANHSYTSGLLNGTNLNDDLRPDLFSFSFMGNSGNFYLDPNGLPKLMVVDSELKIEFVLGPSGEKNTFVITTPDGIKYFFGGDNASESTSTVIRKPNVSGSGSGGPFVLERTSSSKRVSSSNRQPIGGGSGNPVDTPPEEIDYDVIPKAITGFYLYKIVHPFGDEILIDYHDDGDKEYTMFQGDYLEKLKNDNYNNISEECSLQFFGNTDNTTIQRSVYKGKVYNRKKISKIHSLSSNYEVRFLSTNLTLDPDGEGEIPVQYDDRVLNSIEVHNNQISEVTKKIDLEYITTDHRIFLEKVKTKNDINSSVPCSVHKMTYDAPESLPARFSTAQDLFGYYNNQLQNITTLPSYTGSSQEFTGVFSNLGNRALDFNYVKKGSLSKIYYPSGGYTQFDYEAPKVKAISIVEHHDIITGEVSPQNSQIREFYFGDIPEGKTGTVATNQWVRVYASINSTTPFQKKAMPRLKVQLIRLGDYGGVAFEDTIWPVEGAYNGSKVYDIHVGYSSLGNTNYKIVLTLLGSSLTSSITANSNIKHIGYKNIDAYGIRVKRISDYDNNNQNPLVKRYYYTRIEKALTGDEDEESAVITYEPDVFHSGIFNAGCCPTLQGSSIYSYVSLSSNPFGYFFANADNQASYKYVTTSLGGDNFEQGGVENYYRVELNEDPVIEFIPENSDNKLNQNSVFLGGFTDNKSILNGVLLGSTNYKNNGNNQVAKTDESEYTYNITSLNQTTGLILSSNTKNCLLSGYKPIIAYYKNDSYDFDLTSVKNRVYTGTLPSPTETGVFMESEKTFQYGTLQGMPIKTQTYNSEGDAFITKNHYLTPLTISNLSGLSTSETTAYNNLISQFRIGAPIQVENYVKNGNGPVELRGTQRFTFDVFNGKTLPKTTKSSKMNLPLETGATIHQYDANGYALESSNENGVRTSIIYGYKDRKIIAKLVDVSYAAIISVGIINDLQTKANNVTNVATMQLLEVALDGLRTSFPNAYVTTYVYNKLGQLDSTKDARGNEIKYEYDDCFRLKQVKDRDGNILKEHFYNITNNQ